MPNVNNFRKFPTKECGFEGSGKMIGGNVTQRNQLSTDFIHKSASQNYGIQGVCEENNFISPL